MHVDLYVSVWAVWSSGLVRVWAAGQRVIVICAKMLQTGRQCREGEGWTWTRDSTACVRAPPEWICMCVCVWCALFVKAGLMHPVAVCGTSSPVGVVGGDCLVCVHFLVHETSIDGWGETLARRQTNNHTHMRPFIE